ncbi:glycosyltransferase [Aurantiacibacter poecillastricola]|uniref:glycosyltransferase n=1 Tax=Aurantiacibacter poecillastricola TaxID=3064385 RepID=UPI00273F7D5D|nr:glycosyltransferase [Aurantiacibacter sp. 219JJ12-13]MDP5259998.1 glycosyltransferase [Aurantiacibacter sp. 219JJ12-13]
MKVLHIITGLNVGGAENMLCKLLENPADSTTSQAVLSLLEPGPLAERVRATGTPLCTLGMKRALPGARACLQLLKTVKAIGPDVLHGWMYHGNLAASFAKASIARDAALIWNVRHSLADPGRESRKTQAILKLSAAISRHPARIIYNSLQAAAEHERAGYSRAQRMIIPNGFDFDRFRPDPEARQRVCREFGIDPSATIVASVARYHPMKNHALLVDAVSKARAAGYRLHLVMIGAGVASCPDLGRRIDQRLPSGEVTVCEARSDLADLMPGFDILGVSSSWGEGFPNVIGEALACGVSVVSTDVGDSASIVAEQGLVVPPDDVSAFAAALGKMCALGPEGRAAMGREGRKRVKAMYAIREISRKYDHCYEIAARAQGPAYGARGGGDDRAKVFPR